MERDKGEKVHEREHWKALKVYIKKSLSVPESNEESDEWQGIKRHNYICILEKEFWFTTIPG